MNTRTQNLVNSTSGDERSVQWTRRKLLFMGSAGALSIAVPSTVLAAQSGNRILTCEGYTIDAQFGVKERAILTDAIGTFYARFLQHYYDWESAFYKTAAYHFQENVVPDYSGYPFERYGEARYWTHALMARMRYYFLPKSPSSLGLPFPHITINYVNEPSEDFVAQAKVGIMHMHDAGHRDGPNWTGRFELDVNDWYVANGDYESGFDSDYWAGVIAHELLHNLGLRHPPSREEPSYYRHQLILWEMAVMQDAPVRYGARLAHPVRCRRHPG